MSIDDYNPDSSYQQYKRDRYKINNLVGFASESSRDFPRCSICLEQWRLDIVDSPDGNGKVGICKRGCGKSYQLEQQKEQQQKQLNLKHGQGPTTPIMISQKSKSDKRKVKFDTPNNSLTDEDLNDLRSMGYRR